MFKGNETDMSRLTGPGFIRIRKGYGGTGGRPDLCPAGGYKEWEDTWNASIYFLSN